MTSCNLVIGAICARVISMRAFEHMIPSSSGEHILKHSLPALTLVASAASALAAAVLPVVVRAQTSPAPGPSSTLEPIEVTGSLIRSTDRVTFNQVQVITAQDIESSGEVTVADYLRDLALGQTIQLDSVEEGVVNPGNADPGFVDATKMLWKSGWAWSSPDSPAFQR